MVCGTYFVGPLLGAYRVAMQGIDNRITAAFLRGVTRRQEDNDIAVDGIAFQIAFQCRAVNLDVLHCHGFGAGHDGRHIGLNLR